MECKLSYSVVVLICLVWQGFSMVIDGKEMSIDQAIIKAGSNDTKMFELMQDKDTVMVELDMLYPMKKYMEMREEMTMAEETDENTGSRKKRKAIIPESYYRWRNRTVSYEITNDFTAAETQLIRTAISDYHNYTCIRFVPATSTTQNKVRFLNGAGCSSYVGMIGGTQPIYLAPGCRYKGIIIHEMGHAIGFQHEQTRADRDTFVLINTQNIQTGLEYNFMRYSSNQVAHYGVPYDYSSVMHYSQYAFTSNGQPTIIARDSKFQNAMGNREGLSYNDIRLANEMYECASSSGCQELQCPTGAFQGQDCKCYCASEDRSNPVVECQSLGAATTPPVTPTVSSCSDQSDYCSYWAGIGECERNPSYMSRYCQKSCNTCQGMTTSSSCVDSSKDCQYWIEHCNSDVFSDYLKMNCARSCGYCAKLGDTNMTILVNSAEIVVMAKTAFFLLTICVVFQQIVTSAM